MTNNGFLRDYEGNKSSKRLWGTILLIYAMFLTFIAFGYSLFKIIPGETTIHAILEFLYFFGTALLGITVAEPYFINKFKKNIGKQDDNIA